MLLQVKVIPATNTKPHRYSVKSIYLNPCNGEVSKKIKIFGSDYEFSAFHNMEKAAKKMAECVYAGTCGELKYLGNDGKIFFFEA